MVLKSMKEVVNYNIENQPPEIPLRPECKFPSYRPSRPSSASISTTTSRLRSHSAGRDSTSSLNHKSKSKIKDEDEDEIRSEEQRHCACPALPLPTQACLANTRFRTLDKHNAD